MVGNRAINVELATPAINIPLDDGGLILLGRITAIWGQIDWYINGMIERVERLTPEQRRKVLGRASIGPRLDMLKRAARKVLDAKTREHMIVAYDAVKGVIERRNALAHGRWGWWTDAPEGPEACVFTGSQMPAMKWSDLGELHNAMADASVAVDRAWAAVFGTAHARGRNLYVGQRQP